MAKTRRPRRVQGNHARACAWCADALQSDYVTVTFPDKTQATFHIGCLYQYRAVMWPRAPR